MEERLFSVKKYEAEDKFAGATQNPMVHEYL